MADLTEQDIKRLIDSAVNAIKAGSPNARKIQERLVQEAKTIKNYRQLNAELEKKIQKDKTLIKDEDERVKLLKDLNYEYDQQLDVLKRSQKVQEDVFNTAKKLAGGLFSLGDASVEGAEKISFYTSGLKNAPFLGVVDELGQSLDFNIAQFRQLASVGADFGQSLIGMRIAARNSLLPLKEFTDFVGTESQLMAGIYGSANRGAIAVSELARGIREDLIDTFAGLGITTSEYLDYLGTFLDLSRVQGRQENLDRATVTAGIRDYVQNLDRVTKLTGIQRDELNKQIRAQRADAVLQTYLQRLAPERRQELQTFLAGLKGINPALGSAVSNILATGFPLGDFEENLIGTNGNLMTLIDGLRSGTIDTNQFAKGMANSADLFLNQFSPQVLRANQNLGEVGNALTDFRRQFSSASEIQRQQLLGNDELTKQIGVTQEALRQFKSTMEGMNTSFLQAFGPSMSGILKIMEGGAIASSRTFEWMQKNMGPVVGMGVIAAGIGKTFFSYAEQVGIIASGVAIGNGKGLSGAFKMLTGTIGEMGKYLAMLGKAIGVIAGVFQIFNDIMKVSSDDPKKQREGLLGMALGTIAAVITGIITKSPALAALAYGVGSMAGNAIGGPTTDGKVPGFAGGGNIRTGSMALVGERGPELALAGTSGTQIVPLSRSNAVSTTDNSIIDISKLESMFAEQTNTFKLFSDLMQKSEKHLNMLVGISAQTQKNTETSTRRLANLSPNLV